MAAKKKATAAGRATISAEQAGAGAANGLRVRMYRVGFGDFFLVTVPTKDGPRFILIDCGVHAGNIGTIGDCVKDLGEVTGRKLALVIVTHNHADHLSGFATQAAAFAQFEVECVWITNRLDPRNAKASDLKRQITSLAQHLQLRLAARDDPAGKQAQDMAQNALGVAGGSNDQAIQVVTGGFKNGPPVYYYEAGDEAQLPESLQGALTARILGPAPIGEATEFSASDNKAAQYFSAVEKSGLPDSTAFKPFEQRWPASAGCYPAEAFKPWSSPEKMEAALHAEQPDVLAAAANTIDGTLNNQSLVVLFTCGGKKLLFVGDAQWGNWAYWLYGKAVKGQDPGITTEARELLASVDFYKVGHHGSTNATPVPVVGALRLRCVGMCSTEAGCYGSIEMNSEVPRGVLMDALEKRTGNQLVRSDWIAAGAAKASTDAHAQLEKLPPEFVAGDLFIEYAFPD